MGLVSPTQSNAGDTIEAADINTPVNQLAAVINGNIDANNLAANGVTATAVANAAITASKLATGATSATVSTSQTTTSTTYTDLVTVGPTVTVTVGANGLALVILTGRLQGSGAATYAMMSYNASGANTITASDNKALYTAGVDFSSSWVYLEIGLTPGSTTFTSKYRCVSGTATFLDRRMTVVPL